MKPEINNNIISKDKLKDVLVTKTAIKTLKPVLVVERVVNHSFKMAAQALRTHRDVEVSGFGIFKTNDYRGIQLIERKKKQIREIEERLKSKEYSESGIENYNKTIDKLKIDIDCITSKMNKPENEN